MTGSLRRSQCDEDGFTAIELIVTTLIMAVVIAIAGGALYSLTVAAGRNSAVVTNEQRASQVLTQLARDIRSASAISFPSSSPSTEVELTDNVVTGTSVTTTTVIWSYNGTTLSRTVGTTPSTAGPYTVTLANNVATNPVFSYYTYKSPNVPLSYPTDSLTDFSTCATDIGVDLVVAATVNNSTSTFEDTDQVALTNQLDTLTAPGNGYCQ